MYCQLPAKHRLQKLNGCNRTVIEALAAIKATTVPVMKLAPFAGGDAHCRRRVIRYYNGEIAAELFCAPLLSVALAVKLRYRQYSYSWQYKVR